MPDSAQRNGLDHFAERIRAALAPDEAAIAWWVVNVRAPGAALDSEREPRMSAFVLRRDSAPKRFDLGPLAPIRVAAHAWRGALLTGDAVERECGERLR